MAAIGSVTCKMVRGRPLGPNERVQVFVTPGFEGIGAQLMGKNDAFAVFEVVTYDTQANVETWLKDLEALQGTVVTIVNDFADSFANMLIRRVLTSPKRLALHQGGVRGAARIEAIRTEPV